MNEYKLIENERELLIQTPKGDLIDSNEALKRCLFLLDEIKENI